MTSEIKTAPTILRRKQLEARLSLARSTIYDLLRHDESFPKPVRLGRRAVGWIEAEVDAWLASRMAARHGRGS
jgi:prophage regulatory protein